MSITLSPSLHSPISLGENKNKDLYTRVLIQVLFETSQWLDCHRSVTAQEVIGGYLAVVTIVSSFYCAFIFQFQFIRLHIQSHACMHLHR